MTMKERRAQVVDLRAPKEPGAVIELPDRMLKAPSRDGSPAKDGSSDDEPRLLATSPVMNVRVAPNCWFGVDTYDNSQRLIDENGPAGKTSYTYNAKGQVTSTTSPQGKTTTFAYKDQGYLTAQTSPSGAKQTFTYDAAGKLLSSTDLRGNVTGPDSAQYTTTYFYNKAGLLALVTDPAGNTTTTRYEYASNENRSKTTDLAALCEAVELQLWRRA